MKNRFIIICLSVALLLSGCNSKTVPVNDENPPAAYEESDISEISTEDKENSMISDVNTKIKEVLGCNDFEASMISEILEETGLSAVDSIAKNTSMDDNSLLVTSNQITYEVAVDLQYGVYYIKNTSNDEYIYAVYE